MTQEQNINNTRFKKLHFLRIDSRLLKRLFTIVTYDDPNKSKPKRGAFNKKQNHKVLGDT